MRLTKYHLPTIKEAPSEAEVISHQLMIRAGMIRKLASGIYSLLPLGVRVIRKVEKIIREEMDKAGALEVSMPSIQPSELWQESKRWDFYGKELLRITDRHGREFCYGPTHEEVVTDLIRRDVRSYRDLPLNLYQIQTKFRDEVRPRFGVMRAREFTMKDAYSFDVDDDSADISYESMYKAYMAIFTRLGLTFRAVEADTGQIGGSSSHEFMVLAESGEDTVAYCESCEYAANVEKVELRAPIVTESGGGLDEVKSVDTPNQRSIEEVATYLNIEKSRLIKTLIYTTDDDRVVAVLLRGDREINEIKLARAINANEVALADDNTVEKKAKTVVGYAGPVGLSIETIADLEVESIVNGVTGANETDKHLTGVNPGRDFTPTKYVDLREAVAGDKCPRCDDGVLSLAKGIEVGHIFKLGKKYSESMGAKCLDDQGKEQAIVMGCYGIGVGRSAAASIEQSHDDNGIIWPPSIAPFDVVVLPLGKDGEVMDVANLVYEELLANDFDPAIDDRNLRPGVKFNDADLVGYPVQVVIGKKGLADGVAELKVRKTGERSTAPINDVVKAVREAVESVS